MRHHDITDSIEVINFKIAWYTCLAQHQVSACDLNTLLSHLADVRAKLSLPPDIATTFIPMLREEHSLYSNLIGNFICRSALEKLGLYDETLRPAPVKVEMGRMDDVSLFYHADTREYEVSNDHIGVRFPALYVPVFGMDIADEDYAAVIALAILSSTKTPTPPFAIADKFPSLNLEQSLSKEKKSRRIPQKSVRNFRR